ncbi:hypothetical protein HK105_206400 [Polyrhizophydium stewartii]|uniref:Ankyrin repeat protein n=1 Tax=Polyrhizophydium stewartii TaxID=2732419 RepID=A0ABR4N3N5_9FUNG|nr:hypothetical protein HK105_008333 [Polyrhizophydium stewartii]
MEGPEPHHALAAALGLALAPLINRLDALQAHNAELQAQNSALRASVEQHAAATQRRIDGLAAALDVAQTQCTAAAHAAREAATAAAASAASAARVLREDAGSEGMADSVAAVASPSTATPESPAGPVTIRAPPAALLTVPSRASRRSGGGGGSMRSRWDVLPTEIHNKILAHAGILTQYINGRVRVLSWKQFLSLLSEVFSSDWRGDLSKLPMERFKAAPWFEPFCHVRTRSMYARIKALGHEFLNDGLDQAAICNGWTDLLDFTRRRELSLNAAKCGSISMLWQLMTEQPETAVLEVEHVCMAACYGHLELLKWLAARMPDGTWTTAVMDFAAANGHLDCVKWLSANRTDGCSVGAMNGAARHGSLVTVMWLHKSRAEGCTPEAMNLAAQYGHLAVVEFLHEHRTEGCTGKAMLKAAENGHADIVEFLFKNRAEGNIAEAAMAAARRGRPEVIKRIFRMEPAAVTYVVADEAAAYGRAGILDFVADHTSSGHLRLLPWFRDRMPGEFRAHAMSRIGVRSAESVIEWFRRSDLPSSPADVLRMVLREGNMDVIRWLMWHLPDTPWYEGDAACAQWMMRAM